VAGNRAIREGIVSKRRDSRYRSGRSPDWIKSKNPDAPAVRREAEEDWESDGCGLLPRKRQFSSWRLAAKITSVSWPSWFTGTNVRGVGAKIGPKVAEVPPQARTCGLEAGKSTWFLPSVTASDEPLSPDAAVIVTPSAAADWQVIEGDDLRAPLHLQVALEIPFIWTKSAGEILEKGARANQALESED
jgi:hypothetical protein